LNLLQKALRLKRSNRWPYLSCRYSNSGKARALPNSVVSCHESSAAAFGRETPAELTRLYGADTHSCGEATALHACTQAGVCVRCLDHPSGAHGLARGCHDEAEMTGGGICPGWAGAHTQLYSRGYGCAYGSLCARLDGTACALGLHTTRLYLLCHWLALCDETHAPLASAHTHRTRRPHRHPSGRTRR
jgi:hypothetical protein